MPEIKSIKDGTVINRNPPLFPGNDAATGAAVGSPSMNGIRWTRASSGPGKLASFSSYSFSPFFSSAFGNFHSTCVSESSGEALQW